MWQLRHTQAEVLSLHPRCSCCFVVVVVVVVVVVFVVVFMIITINVAITAKRPIPLAALYKAWVSGHRLLGSRVRIPLETWFPLVSVECCQVYASS
jgi:hypothetical protein